MCRFAGAFGLVSTLFATTVLLAQDLRTRRTLRDRPDVNAHRLSTLRGAVFLQGIPSATTAHNTTRGTRLTAPSFSHRPFSHVSNASKNSDPDASPSPRSTSRIAPCAARASSTSRGTRWYVFTQSRFPHPNTANLTSANASASFTLSSQLTKWPALSAGRPSNDAVTITTGLPLGRFAETESSVPMDARKPEGAVGQRRWSAASEQVAISNTGRRDIPCVGASEASRSANDFELPVFEP